MEQIRLKSELDKQSNMVSPCEHSTTKKPVNMLSKAGNQGELNIFLNFSYAQSNFGQI